MPFRRLLGSITALALLPWLGGSVVHAGDSLPLKVVARVALPGASVRFDYTSLDPTADRLVILNQQQTCHEPKRMRPESSSSPGAVSGRPNQSS